MNSCFMKEQRNKSKSKLIIYNGSNILVLEKNKKKKRYVLAGGVLKKGESPELGLIREVEEETGVSLTTNDIALFSSVLAFKKNEPDVMKHYFVLINNGQRFINKEPQNFKSIHWVDWTEASEFLNPDDKGIIEQFYNETLN